MKHCVVGEMPNRIESNRITASVVRVRVRADTCCSCVEGINEKSEKGGGMRMRMRMVDEGVVEDN